MLRTVLVLVVAIQVGLPLALLLLRRHLMFFPSSLPPEAGLRPGGTGAGDVAVRLVHVVRPDGRRLGAYEATPPSAAAGVAVLFLHGNAGCIAHRADAVADLARGLRATVLMPDYSGYGGNEGTPTETEVVADAEAAFDHLARREPSPRHVVIYGESLGGAVALALAARRPAAAVVAQSTFRSASSMARRIYPWLPLTALLARDVFPGDRHAAGLGSRLLVVHGDRDGVIPLAEGRSLHEAVPGSAFHVVPGGDHDGLRETGGEPLRERLRAHVAACIEAATPAPPSLPPPQR